MSETVKKGKKTTYLDTVEFDPNLRKAWWAQYVTNIRWVILFILMIVVVGITSFTTLPTRLNPEVKIPIVQIVTTLPGASPDDVEKLVTEPLEAEVAGVEGLNTMTSYSQENVSIISLEFSSSVDRDKAREDTQSLVDTVTGLPEDAETPRVSALDFEDQPIWQFALVTKGESGPTLFTYAQRLKERIEASSRVDRVVINGNENQEIQVLIKPEKARELGLNPAVLLQSVRAATGSFPAGSVTTNTSTFSVSIDPQVANVQELRNLRITTNGTVQRLGDVAEVSERSTDAQPKSFYAKANGAPQRAVNFSVYKTSNSNIDDAEKEISQIVEEEIKKVEGSFEVRTIINTAEEITEQFADLQVNFRDTIILVFLVLVAFLGFRQAIIASFTIPLTFLSAFGFMQAFDLSINFLTLFSLLLSLGLLIDDTVVTVQAMTSYYKTGKFSTKETGIMVWRDFIVPIWSTTITTVWAFAPLLLASGIIGEFIKSIPIVVSFTLISSTAIAVLVTLPLMIFALKPNIPGRVKVMFQIILGLAFFGFVYALSPKNLFLPFIILGFVFLFVVIRYTFGYFVASTRNKISPKATGWMSGFWKGFNQGFIDMQPVDNLYKRTIARIIANKGYRRTVLILVGIFSVFSYLLVPAGFVQNEFFPKSDNQQIYVNVELPAGTAIDQTNQVVMDMMKELQKTPELDYLTGDSGQSFSDGFGGGGANSNLATFTLNLKEDRKISSIEVAKQLRKQFAVYDRGTVTIVELSGGPPAGSDLQIKLLGNDLQTLDSYASKIVEYLDKEPGIQNISKSVKPGTSKLVFVPDYGKLAENGISQADIGQQLRVFASGLTLDTITLGDEDRDIVFRYGNDTRTAQDLSGFMVQTSQGPVPLTSLGTLQLETNPTLITRENQKRTMSVSAGVSAGFNNVEINRKLEAFADSLNLPAGYEWQTGGVNEENAKSVQSILQAMILAFILIFGTMVLQFGSYRQAVIVLLVIPLAISGVFIVFSLTGTPLSFPALIGILALFGIVVNNSMVIMDKINLNLREGLELKEAIADAAGSRLEPILLTSLLSMIGLVPITLSDPLWQGLGGAIISGLLFSGAIMLFFIPVVYYIWFKGELEKNSA